MFNLSWVQKPNFVVSIASVQFFVASLAAALDASDDLVVSSLTVDEDVSSIVFFDINDIIAITFSAVLPKGLAGCISVTLSEGESSVVTPDANVAVAVGSGEDCVVTIASNDIQVACALATSLDEVVARVSLP